MCPRPCRSAQERQSFSPYLDKVLPPVEQALHDLFACRSASYMTPCQCSFAMQDSDRFWHVPPPAAEALQSVLEGDEVVVAFAWSILRSNPAVSSHGGPLCHGTTNVTLSRQSRVELLDILQVGPSL